MIGEIVKATQEHAIRMAPNMRYDEVLECMDSTGMDAQTALLNELDRSESAWSWIVDGEVACMFGIVGGQSLMDPYSYPWFLTTPLVERHYRAFARACKALLPELLERHPTLCGMVDSRYALSVRWLEWLGARLGEPQPWGVSQAPFRYFEIGA